MHVNEGHCSKCAEIFDRYGCDEELRTFIEALQVDHPELHISCAGRDMAEQEALFHKGATKARFGHSSHNFRAAVDMFFLIDGKYNLEMPNFLRILVPNLYAGLTWFGRPDAPFRELPHLEIKNWVELVHKGQLKIIES